MAPPTQQGGAAGSFSSFVGGLLGAAAGLLDQVLGRGKGNTVPELECMPAEAASLPGDDLVQTAGNPVDLVGGSKLDRAIDLHLRLPRSATPRRLLSGAPVEIVFSRLYSSSGSGSEALGPGWRHGFETRLHAVRDTGGELRLQVLQADGRLVGFGAPVPGADGVTRHVGVDRDDGSLEQDAEGSNGSDAPGWVWTWRDGRRLHFDSAGWLTRVERDAGERLVLVRDPRGRLVSIEDAAGRWVRLRYARVALGEGDAERLVGLELPGGKKLAYRYDVRGRLDAVRHPDGAEVRYRYDRDSARLASVALPDGRASEYRYDDRGRVRYSRGAGQGDALALSFDYRDLGDGDGEPGGADRRADGRGGVTTVSRDGRVLARYRWQAVEAARARIVEALGEGCESCPPTGVRHTYRKGRLEALEYDGVGVRVVRDSQGRVARLWRGADLVMEIEWADDPLLDRPVRVSRPSVVPGRRHALRFEYRGGEVRLHETGYAPEVGQTAEAVSILRARELHRLRDASGTSRSEAPEGRGGAIRLPASARPEGHGRWVVRTAGRVVARYWLDDFGRPVAMHSSDTGLTRWRYDANGRLSEERIASGALATHRHDREGRLVSHSTRAPGRLPVTARFLHRDGRLVAIEHPRQSEQYDYDSLGRLTRRTVRLRLESGRTVSFEERYRYPALATRANAHSLPDGSWVEQRRDSRGQIVALHRRTGDGRSAVLVDGLLRGRSGLLQARFGNGARVAIERDWRGKPAQLCHRGSSAQSDRCDLLDHRLRFDARGQLRLWARDGHRSTYGYDVAGRLLSAQEIGPDGGRQASWRYRYDSRGNRIAADRGLASDPRSGSSLGSSFAPVRVVIADGMPGADPAAWDPAGRLLRDRRFHYRWNAMGLLEEVADAGGVVAQHRYNHRGERVATRSAQGWRYFVHDLQRRVVAELDANGALLRQYVYLGDAPLAVIDPGRGDALAQAGERIAYLHLDHRGAPVLATDASARPLWQARHAPFGRIVSMWSVPGFALALRLPGQYEDPATGLHHNDHRWYDPDTGRYLSPDPLGLRGGDQLYAYAGSDPLARIDPSGLLLFAFDGTGNSHPPPGRDDWSNVFKLAQAYADGRVWYMAGVGLSDEPSSIESRPIDMADGYTARQRVDHMLTELSTVAASAEWAGRWIDVDVIGFSRGAAMARDFANQVADRIEGGEWTALGSCVRLRFLGLWDTVAQFGLRASLGEGWRLSIPADVAYAAHAVALNEHRTTFPVDSIAGGAAGGVRIERGFIGAHSDIGGSYPEGDLSDVALGWMHAQAVAAGVPMFPLTSEFTRVSAPLLHDSRIAPRFLRITDRWFVRRNERGGFVDADKQKEAEVGGMAWRDTNAFIEYFDQPRDDVYGNATLVGSVLMENYAAWLAANYGFEVGWGP